MSVSWAAQPSVNAPAHKSADDEWQEIKNLGKPDFSDIGGSGKMTAEEGRRQFVNRLLDDADRLQQFQAKHPTHGQSKEAKRLEALALLQAWQAGDDSRAVRRVELVRTLRADPAIAAGKRSEIAALASNIDVGKRQNLSGAAKLAAYEEVARNLVAEFPDLPDAYEALVQIAKDSSDERGLLIAKDLLAMAGCPLWVKKEAQAVAHRYSLIGKSGVEATKIIFAQNNPFANAAGSRLVVYTWSTQHTPSIARAKELSARVADGAKFIGVCLDQGNLDPAKARAKVEALPGEQIYDWLGRRGEIAEALGAVDAGLIYLIDATGIIRSVSAQRDLAAALAVHAAQ